jgi:hypothetical protein
VLSRAINPKQRGRRPITALALFALVAGTLLATSSVLAVHDEGVFELEGNAVAGSTGEGTGTDPHNPQATLGGEDWDVVYGGTATAGATTFLTDETLTSTLAGAGDSILFGGSTKDINDLPSWAWKQTASTSVQDKADIEHAYAAQYIVDKTGEQCGTEPGTSECALLYFGADRFSNSGDTVMGFWFFKGPVGTSALDAGGNGTFTGSHTAKSETQRGDILVVADFRAGGKAPSIQVYEWVTSGGSASTNLDQIGGGESPASCTQAPAEGGQSKDPVPPVGANDPFCATANQFVVTSPWPFLAKDNSGGTSGDGGADTMFGVAEFMEGGINMTALGLGDQCFSTFMAETRASHSVTSTLSDFALGTFGACTSGIVTTPQAAGGGAIPATIGTTARVAVRDHAEITITGSNAAFDGNVKFYLCGPLALDSTSNCSTGGVQIGDAAGETVSGSGGTASLNSATATLTSAGRYCWRAEYSGDEAVGIPASSDPTDTTNTSECFSIGPETPTLTTTASADVTLGNPITDTASLTGTAKQPGTDGVGPGGTINATVGSQADADGTITFSLKGPDDCDASGLTVTGSPVSVSGDNVAYGPVSATPTAIGKYPFVAEYSGDSPNTSGAGPSSCPPGENDGDEEVTVTGTSSLATAQDWLPNDTATLTGDTNLTGTLTFVLYDDGTCGDGGGSAVYTEDPITVTNAASGTEFSTTNTTFKVLEADSGNYSWLVTYDDDNLEDPDPVCESTAITITD